MFPHLILAFCLLATFVAAADPPLFPFSIDADSLAGPADFSYLNHTLTPADRVFVRDGHFYAVGADLKPFTEDDARVKMFGVNVAFAGNFPEERDLFTLLQTIPPYWEAGKQQFYQRMGNPTTEEGKALLRERSPLFMSDKNMSQLVIVIIQRIIDGHDSATGITKDDVNTFGNKSS
jgi:hypothetical protein